VANRTIRWTMAVIFCAATLASMAAMAAQNQVMAELRFEGSNDAEKNAGVWVDGQYVGYVKELNGNKKISLLPGKHEILVRQAWYKDYNEETVLEPGELHVVKVMLAKDMQTPSPNATAELKIEATPERAAVFVDGQFAGHVNEFGGAGKAMLLTPGKHTIRLALPGYVPFETSMNLAAHQKAKIETQMQKGSITEAGASVAEQQ
jgi:PEGA domain-containing protein